MRSMTAMAIASGLFACSGGSSALGPNTSAPLPQPATFAPGPAARPTTGVALPLGKCVNLANMLEAPSEGAWGRAFQDADATRIRQAGFATVRLPVRFSAHALSAPPYTIEPAFMARVHHVLDTNLAAGLNVILDMHHYEELFTDPRGHTTRFTELWRQVAQDFSGAPPNVAFELINEPNGQLNDSNLMAVLTPALAAVRASNPTRPVVIGGQNWSGIESLATVAFPNDPNIVATFHYYDPFEFTHQGAPWVNPVMPTGRMFGTTADNAQLNAALQKVTNFINRTGRVPFLGEYGAYDPIPEDQRVSYYHTITSAFASIGIQSCAWGYTNSFNLWRDATGWDQQLLTAITTTTTVQGGYVIEHDADVAKEQPGPHNGGGRTVGYSFFAEVPRLGLVFRKRILQPGSAIGYHEQTEDEIYYVLSGRGVMTLDGKDVNVGPGTAVLTRTGSSHGLKPLGTDDLVVIINYLAPPK